MRILFAGANRATEGGAESYQRAVIPPLAADGHAIALLYERPAPAARPVLDEGVTLPAWCAAEIGTEAALARAAAWRPDVVYVNGLMSPALEGHLLNRWPGVLFAHAYYGTCASGTKRHAFPRITMCTRTFGPACLVLHHPRRCGGLNPVTMWRSYRLQAARRTLLSRYRTICVASAHMRSEYRRHGVPEDQIHLLHYPPTATPPAPALPRGGPLSRHVVMAGRLTELKGGRALVDALALVGRLLGLPLNLTVLGDGPDRRRLEARAQAVGVAARFLGWTNVDEWTRILRTADLLALPSVWPEPWGLVGLEAACVGVPTVAFAVGGIPEWLEPGVSGELAPADPPTADGLAQAIVRALRDPRHHARLRLGAWERAGRFTMERHLTALLSVLSAVAR